MPFINSTNRIFVINLDKKTTRLKKIASRLKKEGLLHMYERFSPVSADKIDAKFMKEHKYELFPNFELKGHKNKYYNRPIYKAEISCALAHNSIWNIAKEKKYNYILILEDDAAWEAGKLVQALDKFIEWYEQTNKDLCDLLYVGRKPQRRPETEFFCSFKQKYSSSYWGHPHYPNNYVIPKFSYCTHGYLLTQSGINKLVEQKFERKICPADDALSVYLGDHDREDIRNFYPKILNALSVKDPYLVYQDDKSSDIENSTPL